LAIYNDHDIASKYATISHMEKIFNFLADISAYKCIGELKSDSRFLKEFFKSETTKHLMRTLTLVEREQLIHNMIASEYGF